MWEKQPPNNYIFDVEIFSNTEKPEILYIFRTMRFFNSKPFENKYFVYITVLLDETWHRIESFLTKEEAYKSFSISGKESSNEVVPLLLENLSLVVGQDKLSKSLLDNFAATLVDRILDSGTALRVAERIAAVNYLFERLRKDKQFVDAVVTEVTKFNNSFTTQSGTLIGLSETGVNYTYENDQEWAEIAAEEERINKKRKEREEVLRRISQSSTKVNGETGEVIDYVNKASTSNYKITLRK